MPKFNGVSEQGKTGLLWTVFEGEPFLGRRVASFAEQQEAWNYQEFRNNAASGEADDKEKANWVSVDAVLSIIRNPNWIWAFNSNCKYIQLWIDVRDAHCRICNREKREISLKQLGFQHGKDTVLPNPEATQDLMEDKKRLDWLETTHHGLGWPCEHDKMYRLFTTDHEFEGATLRTAISTAMEKP